MFFCYVQQNGPDLCAAGTLLSTLCPPLFCTACSGGIIGTLNNLKTARAHYHKYSLDDLLRSTDRTRDPGSDFKISSVQAHGCVCECVCAFWLPKGLLMDSAYKQNGFLSVSVTERSQNENVRTQTQICGRVQTWKCQPRSDLTPLLVITHSSSSSVRSCKKCLQHTF